jgi:hypothetical protein
MISFKKFYESSINFPQQEACPEIWDTNPEDNSYYLKPEIKDQIIEGLSNFKDFSIPPILDGIRIVGSITTNLWDENTDIDVHISIPTSDLPKEKSFEDWQKTILKFYKDNPIKIEAHPVEYYLQDNIFQDLASDGVYDVMNDEWLISPFNKELNYNPYSTFKGVMDEIQKYASEADTSIGELKRDIIDYESIKNAMSQLDKVNKEKLKKYLQDKYEEINDDIQALLKFKLTLKNARKHTSKPKNEKEANKLRNDKTWLETNAIFKFIAKYGYLKLITDIEELLNKDQTIEPEKISDVKDIVK